MPALTIRESALRDGSALRSLVPAPVRQQSTIWLYPPPLSRERMQEIDEFVQDYLQEIEDEACEAAQIAELMLLGML